MKKTHYTYNTLQTIRRNRVKSTCLTVRLNLV